MDGGVRTGTLIIFRTAILFSFVEDYYCNVPAMIPLRVKSVGFSKVGISRLKVMISIRSYKAMDYSHC